MDTQTSTARNYSGRIVAPEAERPHYGRAEAQFETLLETEALDDHLATLQPLIRSFEQALTQALNSAYHDSIISAEAHLFVQRILYRINRLKLFWYDDLQRYTNERSSYLHGVRGRIEEAWQGWEAASFDFSALKQVNVEKRLHDLCALDLESGPSDTGRYFRDELGEAGYCRMLQITSLDGLVEASQLSRMLGGVSNEIHAMLTRLFLEEYGGGRLPRKHSTYFQAMLSELDLRTEPEAYFDVVPWEILANINHSFLLSERKRYFLRYIGGLLYTEVSVPSSFCHYSSAARRLGLPQSAMGYWDLHVREDERHGRWMLHDVALPLVARYPNDAWELVLGYVQQQGLSGRAGEAVARASRQADAAGVAP